MMLTECFVAATLTPEKPTNNTTLGVHFHELQPLPALKSTFKKSTCNPNSIAVTRTHVLAAQADKAVVHVYSRDRNNQEAIVPFPERIRSLALAGEKDGAGILALGTEGGRLILWELGTGRQVSTPQHHLQPITSLTVDPTSNFILTGSSDSSIFVWSLPELLSFSASSHKDYGQDVPFSPSRSLSAHRTAITAVAFGHSSSSSNIAISTSKDGTSIVWDYLTGTALHTYLLPHGPLCITLDPADRAFYVGYEDGSIQLVDFFKQSNVTNPLYDPALRAAPSQPPETDRWRPPPNDDASAVISLEMGYDGTVLISGHKNGKIHMWDIATGRFQKEIVDLSAPITNLIMLPPIGFPEESHPVVSLQNVVKPRYESFANGVGSSDTAAVPPSYSFVAKLTSDLIQPDTHSHSSFHDTLMLPSFPSSLLEQGIEEFTSSQRPDIGHSDSEASEGLRTQNALLVSQLENALAHQKILEAATKERDRADWKRKQNEELKAARKKKRRLGQIKAEEMRRKREMGEEMEKGDDEVENEEGMEADLSSDSNEASD